MNFRQIPVLVATMLVLTLSASAMAAPLAQTVDIDDVFVDEVVVESTSTFTLTVRLDEVTTLEIPMQVEWRAQGPNEGTTDEIAVAVSPTILRQGFFSVTVGAVDAPTGTLAVTLAQPTPISTPITATDTTSPTATGPLTTTVTTTTTVPPANATTANAESNLRGGPGTEYEIVGGADAGDVLEIVGQNADGTWLALANGTWIAAFLVNNVPVDLPIVTPAATPVPLVPTPLPPTPPDSLVPTATPAP